MRIARATNLGADPKQRQIQWTTSRGG
jgi:hypothetical protein